MKVTERNQAGREVVVKRTRKPFAYLQELVDACLTTLTARLWATCRWPGTLGDGWKIGDYNFLIASVPPDAQSSLFVQFWSQP